MRRTLLLALTLSFTLLAPAAAGAASPVNLYFFWGNGCPHCRAEKDALAGIQASYPELTVHAFEVYGSLENIQRMQRVGEALGIEIGGVPLTIVGDRAFTGFSPGYTPQQLAARIDACATEGCPDTVAAIVGVAPAAGSGAAQPPPTVTPPAPDPADPAAPTEFTIPILGTFDAHTVSLPVLSVVMGLLDGFNPCAMWTLLFLLTLLVGMQDRFRRWALGVAFIVASAAVYFLFMTAWLQLILFLGFIVWVRYGIGAIALAGGSYSFRQGLRAESGCVVEGDEQRQRVFHRLRALVRERSFLLALLGIVALAFAVNLVELVCSAGLPAVFTQVLALNALPGWQAYGLIALYILFFMLDDLIVFFVTMTTLEVTGITTRYTRVSHLVGGALMVAIGILLIFKPEWLLFG